MDLSQQLSRALADRYDVEREIGAGGMATVYLARDLKHNRKVALKVLRPELGAVLGPERFLSEIQVTANLQHPHLLPLFDSGEAEGHLFYVMPYVEGETLRDRLERERQLPVDEAVRIGAAVASALDYAHRHNMIHRDLKPENILLHEGQPLVTDFGIALAVSVAGGARVTQTGLSLGTPQYMSPEQATGDRQIDARSDIYSLGAVVYEMLTGEPPHMGTTVQAVIARVLTDRPHTVRAQRPSVPEHVEAAVLHALEKLPADRFATAGEFGEALTGARPVTVAPPATVTAREAAEAGAADEAPTRTRRIKAMLPWLTTGAALVLAGAVALLPRGQQPRGWPSLFEVTFTDSVTVVANAPGPEVAISPDGSQLAFVGISGGGGGIFLRRLEAMEARLVRGTEGGIAPNFSPDGNWILFLADGRLRKVPVVGGAAITVADSGSVQSNWGDRGEVIYSRALSLWRVSAEGGAPTLLASPDSQRQHAQYGWAHVLPGGEAALITLWKGSTALESAELGIVSIPEGEVTELGIPGTNPRYLPSRHIVFARSDGSVFAAPFSLRRRRPTGPAVPVLEGVIVKGGGATDLAISGNGTVVYKGGGDAQGRRLLAVDRRGVPRPLEVAAQPFTWPRVSPDGRRIAVTIGPPDDIWTYDLASTTLTRLTTAGQSSRPEWSPDGQRIAYYATGPIQWQPWDGSGVAEVYIQVNPTASEVSFGPPGSYVAIRRGAGDIWIAPLDSVQAFRPFLATPAVEALPRVSPDGRLLAYVTNESGRRDVYVRPLPGPGPRVQVSIAGGDEPIWSPDGREVFYRTTSHLLAATLTRTPELAVARRDTLFEDAYSRNTGRANYDVFPNGREFLMVQGASAGGRLFAIVNWTEELRRRTQAGGGTGR